MSDNEMPDDPLLVPSRMILSDLPAQRRQAHEQLIANRRSEILREIRGLSLAPELRTAFRPDELYRLALPEGSILQKGKDGLYSGVIRDEKGITKHARFSKVNDNIIKLAKGIGTQFMLVSIAMQLNRIERLVESVIGELHRDRLAQVQAGLVSLAEAIAIENEVTRNHTLVNAIQTLNIGLHMHYFELQAGIATLPSPKNGIFDNWGRTKSGLAAKKLHPLHETLRSYLEGLSGIAECYSLLNESNAATASIHGGLRQLSDLDLARIGKFAQLVAVAGDRPMPEEPWQRLSQSLPRLEEQITVTENANKAGGQVYLEISGSELMEVANGQV